MPETRTCPDCGAVLPAVGSCPHCLLGLGLGEAARSPGPDEPAPGSQAAPRAGRCAEDSPAFVRSGPLTEQPGDKISHYKLVQKLGEGGCGVVYLAEQEEPVRRRVALKVIKLGMDIKQVIARFEAERQALALMDHPNIAKVFDAGATQTGRPFFVMELAGGTPLTRFCDENRLTTSQRLTLFTQICQAIQHAHEKGIIHRDLKPSNILVTSNNGAPAPKVIDFGIAKATTDQRLTDQTVFTALEQFLGTPAYMSPEQARLSGADVDTRSDIYSLGVLLYELLTGKTPFDPHRLVQAGLDEIRRIIREEEPPRPSTRLSGLAADEQTKLANRRQVEPPKLVSLLRGDLDWIVMKALEKDRSRRYETANGLAMDVQRHLNNEPVLARPPSRVYRLGKLVSRNKLAFAAGAAVGLSLLAGLAVSTVLFLRQRAANERANQQAAIAQAVNEFLTGDLLGQADSRSQADAKFQPNPSLTVREALDRAAGRIGNRFQDQPLVEAAVRESIGKALVGVGEANQAQTHLERATALRRASLGPDHPLTLGSMYSLAEAYQRAGYRERALPLFQEIARLMKLKLGPDHPDTLRAINNLADAAREVGQLGLALPLFVETFQAQKAKLGASHPDTVRSMQNLAAAYHDAGKFDRSVALFEEALISFKAQFGPNHPETLEVMNNLAVAYSDAGRFDRALPLCEQTLGLMKTNLGPAHPDTLVSMLVLAVVCRASGEPERALPLLEETVKMSRAKLGLDNPITRNAMNNLAVVYQEAGKLDQAISLLEETFELNKAKQGPDHPDTLASMNNLAQAYGEAGKFDQALALSEEAFALLKTQLGLDHPKTLVSMNNLAAAYRDAGRLDQALALYAQTLELRQTKLGPEHPDTLASMNNLAAAYRDAGKLDQAVPLGETTLKLMQAKLGPDHPDTLLCMYNLARSYQGAGKVDQAVPLFAETLKLRRTKLGPNHPDTLKTLTNLVSAYRQAGQSPEADRLLGEVRPPAKP